MTPGAVVGRARLQSPGQVIGMRLESGRLPRLGWLPQNGKRGAPAVNTDAEQGYSRAAPVIGPSPYPYTIGWIQGLLPLADIWRFGGAGMFARLPYGPYLGGDFMRVQGGMEMGAGSSPMKIPKLLG